MPAALQALDRGQLEQMALGIEGGAPTPGGRRIDQAQADVVADHAQVDLGLHLGIALVQLLQSGCCGSDQGIDGHQVHASNITLLYDSVK